MKDKINILKLLREYTSLADSSDKWYANLQGLEFIDKYPQDFIEWINEEDSWAETYVMKYKIISLIKLFDIWVNEKY